MPCATVPRSWNCRRHSGDCSTTSLRHIGGDREMVEILALVLHHDEQAVLVAVELALEDGVPSKTHILNRLHRLIDGKPATPPVVTAPQGAWP